MSSLSVTELYELHEKIAQKLGADDLLTALALANRQGNLEGLLRSIGFESLLGTEKQRPKRIIVLGSSQVNEGKLKTAAAKEGFDPSDIEFYLEYDRLKHFNYSKLRYSEVYGAVFVGPQPHSNAGKGNTGSAITELESFPEIYPPVYRLMDSNELKITVNSFREALRRFALEL